VGGVGAVVGLLVERRARAHEERHVRDVHSHLALRFGFQSINSRVHHCSEGSEERKEGEEGFESRARAHEERHVRDVHSHLAFTFESILRC